MQVLVVGAAGYVGGELLRLLRQHPSVTSITATSRSQAGKRIGEVHPQMGDVEDVFSGEDPAVLAASHDVVFLSLEHGESSKLARGILASGSALVIDLAADFRTRDPALHEQFYGAHPAPDLVPRFTYGLADVLGEALRGVTAIAAPGCFATAAQLALYPIAELAPSSKPSLFAITGSSGAGVHPKPTTHHPARAHNLFAYSAMSHRHEAEVLGSWRAWTGRPDAAARLLTHSGPFVRGIHLTMHVRLDGRASAHEAAGAYVLRYAGRPFVRVLCAPPELTHCVGTNMALIHAVPSEDDTELQVMVAMDNLVKGAGGQAVQAMNLALGLPETAGLGGGGIFPC
jgi:N-acetyl-gamma-glutamyl-phosphate reductase